MGKLHAFSSVADPACCQPCTCFLLIVSSSLYKCRSRHAVRIPYMIVACWELTV